MTDATVPAYGPAPVPWLALLVSHPAQGDAIRLIAGPGDDEDEDDEEIDDEDLDDEDDDLEDEELGDEDEDLDDSEEEDADEDE